MMARPAALCRLRSRAGLPRKELDALVNAAIDVICGNPR
jgi:hypothetical protein